MSARIPRNIHTNIVPPVFLAILFVAIAEGKISGIMCSVVGIIVWAIMEMVLDYREVTEVQKLKFIKSSRSLLFAMMSIIAICGAYFSFQNSVSTAVPRETVEWFYRDAKKLGLDLSQQDGRVSAQNLGSLSSKQSIVGVGNSSYFVFIDLKDLTRKVWTEFLSYIESIMYLLFLLALGITIVIFSFFWIAQNIIWPLLESFKNQETGRQP